MPLPFRTSIAVILTMALVSGLIFQTQAGKRSGAAQSCTGPINIWWACSWQTTQGHSGWTATSTALWASGLLRSSHCLFLSLRGMETCTWGPCEVLKSQHIAAQRCLSRRERPPAPLQIVAGYKAKPRSHNHSLLACGQEHQHSQAAVALCRNLAQAAGIWMATGQALAKCVCSLH